MRMAGTTQCVLRLTSIGIECFDNGHVARLLQDRGDEGEGCRTREHITAGMGGGTRECRMALI